jgi:hypothetical protein
MRSHFLRAVSKGVPTSLSYITATSVDLSSSLSSPNTFKDVSIGVADTNRYVVIAGHLFANAKPCDLTGITIGGVSATLVTKATYIPSGTNNTVISSLWIASVPTGTTADVVYSVSGNVESRGIGVYRLITSNPTAFDTDTSQGTLTTRAGSLSTTLNGVAIGANQSFNGANPTWTNATKQYGRDIRSNEWASGAMITSTSGSTTLITCTSSMALAIASWS